MQKQYDSLCLLRKGTEILWKFHSGLHGLIIIVYVAACNALAKVTSLQGTDEEETERKGESVKGGWDWRQQEHFQWVMSVKCTYRFDGVLVNFSFCLPQMMTVYIDKKG